jgi:hypothetical protein
MNVAAMMRQLSLAEAFARRSVPTATATTLLPPAAALPHEQPPLQPEAQVKAQQPATPAWQPTATEAILAAATTDDPDATQVAAPSLSVVADPAAETHTNSRTPIVDALLSMARLDGVPLGGVARVPWQRSLVPVSCVATPT